MEFYPPKTSSLAMRICKMVVFVALIFVLSKLLYESNQLNYFPSYLNNIIFVFTCVYLGWLFRLKHVWHYSKQGVNITANANLFGFVFIVATVNGVKHYQLRLWNPSLYNFKVNPDFDVTISFKPSEKVAVGGCHILCNNQMIKPN
jgi:hypothetical protein